MTMRPRKCTPRRGAPPKKRNQARRNREWSRAYGSKERQAFVQSLPCIVCGYVPCDPAHIKGDGASRKADARYTVPLCRLHHAEQHQFGVETFGARHGLDLESLAAECERAWLSFCGDETEGEP